MEAPETTLKAADKLEQGDVLALGPPGTVTNAGIVHRIEITERGTTIHYFLASEPHDRGGRNYTVDAGAFVEVVV